MKEVTIKAYSRRGKSGKTIQVRSYTRRVGHKGVKSPKRKDSPGEELEKKVEQKVEETKKTPTMTKEEIERRKKWEESFARVEKERKNLGMTREQYSRYLLNNKNKKPTKSSVPEVPTRKEIQKKKDVFSRMEDKIEKFVNKFGGHYKR